MINRDDIEAGDKCFTRDGGCLVARMSEQEVYLGTHYPSSWTKQGAWIGGATHPLDIIRIEKAPKPVVEDIWLVMGSTKWMIADTIDINSWEHAIKLTIINGKLEKSEQVK